MSWIDSGVNLLDQRFDLAQLFDNAISNDVTGLLVISSDYEESLKVRNFCDKHNSSRDKSFPKLAYTLGVHPHHAEHCDTNTWAKLKALMADSKCVAVGECGLDFNRNYSSKRAQLYAFEQQLNLAVEMNLGVYLHERDAFDEQYSLLEQYAKALPFKVAHCFTGTKEQLESYLSLGCYIGITGWLCDQKRGVDLRRAVGSLSLERLLLETDSPYLFPQGLKPRSSTNQPSNLPYIGRYLAELLAVDEQMVEQASYNNAHRLFFRQGDDEIFKNNQGNAHE